MKNVFLFPIVLLLVLLVTIGPFYVLLSIMRPLFASLLWLAILAMIVGYIYDKKS